LKSYSNRIQRQNQNPCFESISKTICWQILQRRLSGDKLLERRNVQVRFIAKSWKQSQVDWSLQILQQTWSF